MSFELAARAREAGGASDEYLAREAGEASDEDLALEACLEDDALVEQSSLLGRADAPTTDYGHLVSPPSTKAGASVFKACANTFISFVGAGVLGLPHAFQRAGVLGGAVILLAVAMLSTKAMLLLVETKKLLAARNKTVSGYGDLGFHAMGPRGAMVVDACIVTSQTAFSIAYLIFIGNNVRSVWGVADAATILACVLPLSALALVRRLSSLAPCSLVADVANIVGLAAVLMSDAEHYSSEEDPIHLVVWSQLPYFAGVASYCYEGAGLVLPLEGSMERSDLFPRVLGGTLALVTTLYVTFGIAGYLSYGDATADVITLNMGGSVHAQVVKLALCLGLMLTHPIMLFPVSEILDSSVGCLRASFDTVSAGAGKQVARRRDATRVALVCFTGVVALAAHDSFGDFIALIGSTLCTLLAYILPSTFHLVVGGSHLSPAARAIDYTIIAFGVVMGVLGTIDATDSMMQHYGG